MTNIDDAQYYHQWRLSVVISWGLQIHYKQKHTGEYDCDITQKITLSGSVTSNNQCTVSIYFHGHISGIDTEYRVDKITDQYLFIL